MGDCRTALRGANLLDRYLDSAAQEYLAAYDAQLRTEAETPGAISVTERPPEAGE